MSEATNGGNGNGKVSGLETDIRWISQGLSDIKESLKDLVQRLDRDSERTERRIDAVECSNRKEHDELRETVRQHTQDIKVIRWIGGVAFVLALAFGTGLMQGMARAVVKAMGGE